jgi:GNAT superfamily N-acetyltransferase
MKRPLPHNHPVNAAPMPCVIRRDVGARRLLGTLGVRSATRVFENLPAVVRALVESLRHDPFYVAITEDYGDTESRRIEALSRYFDYSMSEGARSGRCVTVLDEGPAAAVWLLPGSAERTTAEARAKAAFLAAILGPKGVENYRRIMDFMTPRAQSAVKGSAWYLSIIGVSPAAQGRGIGGRVVHTTLAEADQIGASCFLETFSQRNLPFYQRFGFEVVALHQEPTTRSQYYIMQRTPNKSPERTRER